MKYLNNIANIFLYLYLDLYLYLGLELELDLKLKLDLKLDLKLELDLEEFINIIPLDYISISINHLTKEAKVI